VSTGETLDARREADPELDRRCFIVRDANGQALAYVYFEGELDRRSAVHLLTRDAAGASPPTSRKVFSL
jgi:hypothetical protein